MFQTPSDESPVVSSDDSPRASAGQIVRLARERARMTPDELATLIKLPRHTVDALERDDYDTLNEPVYIRGYYRKCAKVLSLTEKELLDAYNLAAKPQVPALPAKLRLASGSELGSGSRLPVALAIMTAIGAVLVCAFLWFAHGLHAPLPALTMAKTTAPANALPVPTTEPGQSVATEADAATETPVPVTADDKLNTAPAGAPAPAVSATGGANSSAMPTLPAQTSAPAPASPSETAAAAAASSEFTLTMTAASWARVEDATGKMVVNGLMSAGEHLNLVGTAPFRVFLGNAPGVRVEQAGQPLDVSRFVGDNKTARFVLPLPVSP
ncbi:MAG: RodZ domain-containing protein [Stenotrophobium sp.]